MNALEKLSDSDIVSRILQGETALYELIVRRFNPYLYKIGRSFNYSHEDTQDLMQDTYVNTYKNLANFEGRSHFKTWLVRIMINNCYRKQQKSSFKNEQIMEPINDHAEPIFTGQQQKTEKVVHNKELSSVIENSLAQLSEDYRLVFALREINGFNVAETASILSISESNVKVRLNRAKTMLRTALEKQYQGLELFEFNLIYCDTMVNRVMNEIQKL